MAPLIFNGTTCVLNPIRFDPILLLAQPERIGELLQSWQTDLNAQCGAEFESVFMRNRKRSKLRYGVSADESDGHLTDALFKVSKLSTLGKLDLEVKEALQGSFCPDAIFKADELEIYIFSESFATCEWHLCAPESFTLDQGVSLDAIENLMNVISVKVTQHLQHSKFFEVVNAALQELAEPGLRSGRKVLPLMRDTNFTDVEHFLNKANAATDQPTQELRATTELMWTSRLVVADPAVSPATYAKLIPGNASSTPIFLTGGGDTGLRLTPAWGTSLLEGPANQEAYQDLMRIRRKLQAMYAVADNYNHSISELYFGVLAGGAKISKALETAIEACKTHLQQTQLIREDAGIGLQGWKRQTYDAYLGLWKFDEHLGRAMKKADLAMECVHTRRVRRSERLQNVLRKILGSLAALEILSLVMHSFEYAHSEHYESTLWWGLLHALRFHGDADAVLTIMFAALCLLAMGLLFSEGKAKSMEE